LISSAEVECRSDASYGERPQAFTWGSRRSEVAEVLHRWRTPLGIGFWVSTQEGDLFELFYDASQDVWYVHER